MGSRRIAKTQDKTCGQRIHQKFGTGDDEAFAPVVKHTTTIGLSHFSSLQKHVDVKLAFFLKISMKIFTRSHQNHSLSPQKIKRSTNERSPLTTSNKQLMLGIKKQLSTTAEQLQTKCGR
ncbi:hypothetical protein NPIL_428971 [Nephila pilipes]|uniref:Uncharacterized protein n=1 Tax=Nephila pilipes TaxID=299642 RepID=A0A8X6NNC0_NEPPI|nr:hypothetical protein NPIL_428971 [Nephila pilipes]